MAIAPTGAIYKSLIFDGEDSRDYGVYITGQAVFNAPEREVEMITIPARNGLFALDQGRFKNIEVTYPAGIFADTEADFAQAISDFRNALCSKRGYCRLTDDYNPDEYRMAIYKSGLDVKLSELKAGEFSITFECKPQRFLTSGETAVTASSSSYTLTNPTLFESSPLLEVTGVGTIGINDDSINIQDIPLGEIQVGSTATAQYSNGSLIHGISGVRLTLGNVNSGDRLYQKAKNEYSIEISTDSSTSLAVSVSGTTNVDSTNIVTYSTYRKLVQVKLPVFTAYKGTYKSVASTIDLSITIGSEAAVTATITLTVNYDGAITAKTIIDRSSIPRTSTYTETMVNQAFYADSTISTLPEPYYIDLDIGEAYGVLNDEMLSLNNIVSMPAELPVLVSGANTITHTNTITQLKIIPRWWKI